MWIVRHSSQYTSEQLLAHLAFNLCRKQNRHFTSTIAYDVGSLEELQLKLTAYEGSALDPNSSKVLPSTESRPLILAFGGQGEGAGGRSITFSQTVVSTNKLLNSHLMLTNPN